MQFIEAIKFGFKNYFNFTGVVGRSTFWLWLLFLVISYNIVDAIQKASGFKLDMYFIAVIALPTIVLMARRLRDAGFSSGLLTIWLFPFLLSMTSTPLISQTLGFASDPIPEGNAGYIPVHDVATAFVGFFMFVFGILIGSVFIGVLCAMPTKTKEQGNKRLDG